MVAQAEDHYQKSLMMTYGLAPWKRLITIIKHNEHRAMEHHSQVLMRLCFAPWYQITEDTVRGKEKEADSLYRDLLLKSHFRYWQEVTTVYARSDNLLMKSVRLVCSIAVWIGSCSRSTQTESDSQTGGGCLAKICD